MKVKELRDDTFITDWINTINKKPNSVKSYLLAMQAFTEYTGKTPEQLITEAEEEIETGKRMRLRSIKRYLIGFRNKLQTDNLAPLTVRSHLTGVRSFYKSFDIQIPDLQDCSKAKPLAKNKNIPTKDDLREVLKLCDHLERAILLVGASSGLSANEIINLKVSDFNKGYDPVTEITTLSLRRGKSGTDFITFMTPEATRAVKEYIDFRGRTDKIGIQKKVIQLDKQKIFSEDNYLFCVRTVPHTFLESRDENERKLKPDTVVKMYRRLSEISLKNTKKGDWNLIRSHNIRKFFNNTLRHNGADSFFVEICMGHTLDSTRNAYFMPNPEQLKEIYKKYITFLTIQKELDISVSPEFIKLQADLETAKAEAVRHIVENQEMQELRAEINKLKQESENEKQLERKFKQLIACDMGKMNRYPGWRKDYQEHENRMKTDNEYAQKFEEYQKYFNVELYSGPDADFMSDQDKEAHRKHVEKEKLNTEKQKHYKTMSKFFENVGDK